MTGVNSQLVTSSKEEKEVLLEQAKRLGQKRLAEAIALLAKVDSESRWRQNMRIVLEMSLLSLFKTEETVPAGSITSVQVTQGDTKPTVAKVKTKKQSTAKQVVGKEGQEYQKAQNQQRKQEDIFNRPTRRLGPEKRSMTIAVSTTVTKPL